MNASSMRHELTAAVRSAVVFGSLANVLLIVAHNQGLAADVFVAVLVVLGIGAGGFAVRAFTQATRLPIRALRLGGLTGLFVLGLTIGANELLLPFLLPADAGAGIALGMTGGLLALVAVPALVVLSAVSSLVVAAVQAPALTPAFRLSGTEG
ncbi:MAG: hypothetical protein AAGG50_01500 [Bacteroidota bacterium]